MIRCLVLCCTVGFSFFKPLFGQQLEYVVVSATESQAQGSDGGRLVWTLGELMVEYYPNGIALDQGHLQSRFIITSAEEVQPESPDWRLSAWPNPLPDQALNVVSGASLQLFLFDASGRLLLRQAGADEIIQLDFSTYQPGSYRLLAIDEAGRGRALQIQKI